MNYLNQDKKDLLKMIETLISSKEGNLETLNIFNNENRIPNIVATFSDWDYEDTNIYTVHVNLYDENQKLKQQNKNYKDKIKRSLDEISELEKDIKELDKKYSKKALGRFSEYLEKIISNFMEEE